MPTTNETLTSRERVRIAMSGGMPDRVPVIPQICAPHAVRVAGLPFQETIVDRLRHPEAYDLLVADCAAAYGVDGFRVWTGAQPQVIEWRDGQALALDPVSGEVLRPGRTEIQRLISRNRAWALLNGLALDPWELVAEGYPGNGVLFP